MSRACVLRMVIYIECAILILVLAACQKQEHNHPALDVQKTVSARLLDQQQCPAGTLADLAPLLSGAERGSIIRIPSGCYLIQSTMYVPACVRLVGAGMDKTILYRELGKTYNQPILRINGKFDDACQTSISGIALVGVRDTDDVGQDYGVVLSNLRDFRIDHAYFEGFGFAGVRVEGNSSGVIDHSIFIDNFKQGIDSLGYGVAVYGKGSWDPEQRLGGSGATFVEDNIFVGNRHAISSSAGAHYVFRNNQVIRGVAACGVDAHGMGYGSAHGTQYVEIYHNVIKDPLYNACGIGIRGGAGVIFDNMIQGYKNPILLILEWGTPDKYKADYPALDQVQELYIWNNTHPGGAIEPQVDETGSGFIKLARDYFIEPLPGYVPYAYPHPLIGTGPFDISPLPTSISP